RSCPAEKAGPAADITTAATSEGTSRKALVTSVIRARLRALRRSGRSRVIVMRGVATSTRIDSDTTGSWMPDMPERVASDGRSACRGQLQELFGRVPTAI